MVFSAGVCWQVYGGNFRRGVAGSGVMWAVQVCNGASHVWYSLQVCGRQRYVVAGSGVWWRVTEALVTPALDHVFPLR